MKSRRKNARMMRVTITKGKAHDHIRMERSDGSVAETVFPHKGPIPHDAVHYFVERGLGMKNGFWGMVASGVHPEEVQQIAANGGHASATRAQMPADNIVELLQAERLVECFEADLWSPAPDDGSFEGIAATACGYSHVPLPSMENGTLPCIRDQIMEFALTWSDLKQGESFAFDWP